MDNIYLEMPQANLVSEEVLLIWFVLLKLEVVYGLLLHKHNGSDKLRNDGEG